RKGKSVILPGLVELEVDDFVLLIREERADGMATVVVLVHGLRQELRVRDGHPDRLPLAHPERLVPGGVGARDLQLAPSVRERAGGGRRRGRVRRGEVGREGRGGEDEDRG